MTHIFIVPGLPVAQPRQRMRVVASRGRAFASNYTPAKAPVNAFKAAVRLTSDWRQPPLSGPVGIDLDFVLPRPGRLKSGGRLPAPRKPDIDNLCKSVLDALNGLMWLDDAQVCRLTASKWYAASGEKAHTRVSVLAPLT